MCLSRIIGFVSFFLIIGGIQKIYTGFTQRSQHELGIDSLAATKPEAKWLKVTGGVLDATDASAIGLRGANKALEVYIPLVPAGFDREKDMIHVLVLSKDREMLRLYNEMNALKSDNPAEAIGFLVKNRDLLRQEKTVEGVVEHGLDRGGSKERQILKSYDRIAPDVLILDEGETPSVKGGLILMGCGIAGFLLAGLLGSRKKSPPALPSEGFPPSSNMPPPLP